jgi:3-isopropylmalate dehydrogenase
MKIAVLPATASGPRSSPRRPRARRAAREGVAIEPTRADRRRGYDAAGIRFPRRRSRSRASADAVLLGAVGGPQYDTLPRAMRPEQGILGIRKALGSFANLRPALLYPELAGARRSSRSRRRLDS